MALPKLPEQYAPAFVRLSQVDDSQFDDFLEAVERPRASIKAAHVLAAAREHLGFTDAEATLFYRAFISLLRFSENTGENLDELLDLISTSSDLESEVDSADVYRARLERLTKDSVLGILQKGNTLALEHDRILTDGRVLTDIRPVFGDDVDIGMRTVLVTHVLKLESYRNENTETHYFALDEDDLSYLRNTIDRALAKAISIRETLEAAELSFLGVGED